MSKLLPPLGLVFVLIFTAASAPAAETLRADMLTIDASTPPPPVSAQSFHMGTAEAPGGNSLTVDSCSLVRNGKPWLPISGEFHFSRCPQVEWRTELLKMKTGGIEIVSTYIIWIHHEEVKGTWDWTGQRDLHKFLETCKDVGLNVQLRIGPWCHAEVRRGGFPDWLQKLGDKKAIHLRSDDPAYLGYVKELYAQIAGQSKGLLWKDGGPIIGIQLENEYYYSGAGARHLKTLKKIAIDAGFDVPLYTRTGWNDGPAAPFGETLPFLGAYAEGSWDRKLVAQPDVYTKGFQFAESMGGTAAMGALGTTAATGPASARVGVNPVLTCELGGGMESTYHRRVLVSPIDGESVVLAKLGGGANLLGLYMYHGGENPDGRLTYLNETQASGSLNDLPVKSYDFQAPIGTYGQEREHYHWLRLLGLFLQEYGSGLARMSPRIPADHTNLNWAVRSDGRSGYVFVSNYLRFKPQPNWENVQFQCKLAGGDVTVPSEPITIPDNCRFFWPINLDLGGVKLVSASAQPICHVDDQNSRYTAFKQTAGVPSEFVFDRSAAIESSTGTVTEKNGLLYVRNVQPGNGAAIQLHGKDGRQHVILLIDEPTSLDLWKGEWLGQQRLFLTHANLLIDGNSLRLHADDPADCCVGILPAPANVTKDGTPVTGLGEGLFQRFSPPIAAAKPLKAIIEKVQPAGPPRVVPIAPPIHNSRKDCVATEPDDSDFAQAAVWRVKLPAGVNADRDLRLRIHYTGDVARAYLGDKLLIDDFYNAQPFEIGLRRYGPAVYQDGLVLKILPLSESAPIYLTDRSKLTFDKTHTALTLDGIDVVETHELRLDAAK